MQFEPTGMCACGCGSTNWPVPHYALDENGCWTWQRARHPDGYGSTSVRGKTRPAHRHFYEVYVGPIPKGLCIDHLCRNRACVNPAHLEVVTIAENSRRGERVALKTHCANGHPYTSENVTLKKNGDRLVRICRVCKSESQGRWRRKAKQAAEFSPASTGDREEKKAEKLREAARKLISTYMADGDLDAAVNELEAAAGFSQQGAEARNDKRRP